MKRFMLQILALALGSALSILIACGGGGPSTPTPTPSGAPPPPAITSITIEKISPASGSTMKCNVPGVPTKIDVEAKWYLDKSYVGTVRAMICLSVDGQTDADGSCYGNGINPSGVFYPSGTVTANPRDPSIKVDQTNYVIAWIQQCLRQDCADKVILAKDAKPWVFKCS